MIPLYKVFMPNNIEEDLSEVLSSNQLAYGSIAKEFEIKLAKYLGNSLTLTTNNNNVALLIGLSVIDLHPGDEVITSPASCLATNQPVAAKGGVIKFADIDPKTGTLDPESVKSNITSKTKAILHYHWGGYPGYIEEINEIAKGHDIIVIEDASEAFGSVYKGNKIGNTGSDIVCFSFQPVRLLNTIEGGAISFNNKDLYEKALLIRDYGIKRSTFRDTLGEISSDCDISLVGYNGLMNNVNSLIGMKQLNFVNELLKKNRLNAAAFSKKISLFNNVKSISSRDQILPNYWLYSLMVENPRDFISKAKEAGISSSQVHLRNDYYSVFSSKIDNSLIGVKEFYNRHVAIPVGWWLTEDNISSIITFLDENY